MSQPLAPIDIPDKPSFKPSEVCDLLGIPTYVLRTWENEFKDLGVSRTPGGARSYRRTDVELAARIKALVFAEHLTLAGVRRRLEQEQLLAPPPEENPEPDLPPTPATTAALAAPVKERLGQVKQELRSLLQTLSADARAARPPAADASGEGARGRKTDRPRRASESGNPALPGLGDAIDVASEPQLDPAALNFATVSAPPAPRKRR